MSNKGPQSPAAGTPSSSSAASSSRSATKRLIKELAVWEKEAPAETGIERLGPVSEGELLQWEAVINGRGIGGGYDEGRWLLRIAIPPTYPLQPPRIAFATPVVHANVSLETGEICLDLLNSGTGSSSKSAWTPAYSVLECVRAVRMLLASPEPDSPLNVDAAALLRAGDALGARRLVEFWSRDCRFEE
ncbi:E2 ubiquitin-protein ligase peroxin 4 [Eutypa lata]|nr:E2 ubiquitin-protein ligase peroxin 4 [Eutypa lata]